MSAEARNDPEGYRQREGEHKPYEPVKATKPEAMTPTDAELNEKVAAIAGWKHSTAHSIVGGEIFGDTWTTPQGYTSRPLDYATDLNAVVEVLQKSTAFCSLEFVSRDQWTCTLTYASPKPEGIEVFEANDTLARAICLALVEAHKAP